MLQYFLHIRPIAPENRFLLYSVLFLSHSLLFRDAQNRRVGLVADGAHDCREAHGLDAEKQERELRRDTAPGQGDATFENK